MNGSPLIHVEVRGTTLDDLRAFADETQPDLGTASLAGRQKNT